MADSYFWEYQRIQRILKHWKKCIISHQSFLKLNGIAYVELNSEDLIPNDFLI